MEVLNYHLVGFIRNFGALENLTGFDFVLELNYNNDIIQAEVDRLQKMKEPNEKVKAYQKRGAELYSEHSEKNSDGSAKMETVSKQMQRYILDKAREAEFKEKFRALKEEFKEELDLQEARETEYAKALEAPAKARVISALHKFTKKELPDNITTGQLHLLFQAGMIAPKPLLKKVRETEAAPAEEK